MEIRDARPGDATAVATVARASWHAAYDDLLGADTVEATVEEWYDVESLRAEIRETATAEGACFLVADDGGIVGFADAGPARDWAGDPDDPDAFLSRLYVAPERWGEGVGTELTAEAARRLRDAGHERVWLEVFDANERGRGFYESLGFDLVGSVPEEFGGTEVTTRHLSAPLSTLIESAGSPE